MDYYTRKQLFLSSLKQLILEKHSEGGICLLSDWEIRYGSAYGFGRKFLEKALQPYFDRGLIERISPDVVQIKKRIVKPKQTSNSQPINKAGPDR